jgi:hypothetical protein
MTNQTVQISVEIVPPSPFSLVAHRRGTSAHHTQTFYSCAYSRLMRIACKLRFITPSLGNCGVGALLAQVGVLLGVPRDATLRPCLPAHGRPGASSLASPPAAPVHWLHGAYVHSLTAFDHGRASCHGNGVTTFIHKGRCALGINAGSRHVELVISHGSLCQLPHRAS